MHKSMLIAIFLGSAAVANAAVAMWMSSKLPVERRGLVVKILLASAALSFGVAVVVGINAISLD